MEIAKAFQAMVGDWTGRTMYVPAKGGSVVQRTLAVSCRLDNRVMRIENRYTDGDGSVTVAQVRGEFDERGVLKISSERTQGEAWESAGSIVASWRLRLDSELTFWELAVIHEGKYRTRTWHHFRDDRLEGVTVFEERKTV